MSEPELTTRATAPDVGADADAAPEPFDSAKPELTPAQVLELLRQGKPVENVRVRRLKLKGEFEQPVKFKNCTLIQAEVGPATFKQELALVGCSLDRMQFCRPVTCEHNFGLNGSTLNRARFHKLTVNGGFFASGCHFKGTLTIEGCRFNSEAKFWEAKFHCWANVTGCEFAATADFRSLHSDQGLVFDKCEFRGDFLLRGATVHKKLQADGCRFEKLLDLSKAKLHDFVYLEGIDPGPDQRFAFANAVAERILVRPEQVEGRLASECDGQFEPAMQEYGLLKKCFQSLHRFDAEDWAFYRFKVNQRKAVPATWARPWTVWRRFFNWLFLDIGCGYGTNPVRAVRMAIVIILGFAALYSVGIEQFYAEKKPFPDLELTDTPNRVMIGLITSVSVFTSGMGGIREIAKGWMNVPVMIESVMGTLLFGLFIVAFSRKVIR